MDVAVRAAQSSFVIAIGFLQREVERLVEGSKLDPELEKQAKSVNATLQTFLKERDKFEESSGSASGNTEPAGLNLAEARTEIESRLARLRAARDT